MSDAPERIWAVPSLSTERWGDGLCSDTPSNTAKSVAVEYVRADLAPQWQSIESAPKSVLPADGDWTEVLVWNAEYKRCDVARINAEGKAELGDWDFEVLATHWMPLPAPPALIAEGDE